MNEKPGKHVLMPHNNASTNPTNIPIKHIWRVNRFNKCSQCKSVFHENAGQDTWRMSGRSFTCYSCLGTISVKPVEAKTLSPLKGVSSELLVSSSGANLLTRRIANREIYFPVKKSVRSIKSLVNEIHTKQYHAF